MVNPEDSDFKTESHSSRISAHNPMDNSNYRFNEDAVNEAWTGEEFSK